MFPSQCCLRLFCVIVIAIQIYVLWGICRSGSDDETSGQSAGHASGEFEDHLRTQAPFLGRWPLQVCLFVCLACMFALIDISYVLYNVTRELESEKYIFNFYFSFFMKTMCYFSFSTFILFKVGLQVKSKTETETITKVC